MVLQGLGGHWVQGILQLQMVLHFQVFQDLQQVQGIRYYQGGQLAQGIPGYLPLGLQQDQKPRLVLMGPSHQWLRWLQPLQVLQENQGRLADPDLRLVQVLHQGL